ncbi:hypothetical protein BCR33DRAFT_714921 [Rhizoclosmatium globosum]|uniref:Uncharacterized protein n=1 Tax=Rhizoclosmatium globosum TaxID=329046 RepID=A0A1Y2CLN2_9FUNG|nr:hypothetical protein BCR33DRAFT_714921 [Rhizoclosmatium globosum]|eukprot:ORY47866.1 hypothetical protein BCR33DRAFT_714921 [Rhizoclosmatium globosum]
MYLLSPNINIIQSNIGVVGGFLKITWMYDVRLRFLSAIFPLRYSNTLQTNYRHPQTQPRLQKYQSTQHVSRNPPLSSQTLHPSLQKHITHPPSRLTFPAITRHFSGAYPASRLGFIS